MEKQRGVFSYNRGEAVNYAHKWAYKRNPEYVDFENYGGDCTNFASQVIFAGSGVMNLMSTFGWYYKSINDRTPSWTGVGFLYDFLINNKGIGPYAEIADVKDVQPGDIAQLSFNGGGHFNHTPVIVSTGYPARVENILVAAHTDDQDNYSLRNFDWVDIRFIHILGVRWT